MKNKHCIEISTICNGFELFIFLLFYLAAVTMNLKLF